MKICEEKSLESLQKCPKSSLFILFLLIPALFLYYNLIYSSEDELEWNCPSCPPLPPKITTPSPTPSPSPGPTTISHIAFAIGGSSATWNRRRLYTQLWWDPSSTRGHVWLDRRPDNLSDSTMFPPIKISPDSYSRFGQRSSASRIASLVAESYKLELENIRWFVMGDDDTVFFTDNLVSVLNKYDHNEMYYIGAPSESVEQDEMHSYSMAFGGGGFAVSSPAARELARVMDGCLERYRGFWGSDQRVMACLSEIGVPLTTELGFHQVDLRGDIYGLLAAHPLTPLISLHHLDSVKPIIPSSSSSPLDALKTLTSASKSDPARILQQTFCYVVDQSFNWSVSVSWGYTVQIYPWILPANELQLPLQTFQTWRSYKNGPFLFNTRKFKLDDECDSPVRFFLDRLRVLLDNTTTITEYFKYDDETKESKVACNQPGFVAASRVDLVRVIARRLDQKFWRKAPRRQCCETRRVKRGTVMEVKIRDCYPGEVTSPQ